MGNYFSDVVEQAITDIYYCYDNNRAKAAEAELTLAWECWGCAVSWAGAVRRTPSGAGPC